MIPRAGFFSSKLSMNKNSDDVGDCCPGEDASGLPVTSTTAPAMGGPERAANPRKKERNPKACVSKLAPSRSVRVAGATETQQPVRNPKKAAMTMYSQSWVHTEKT